VKFADVQRDRVTKDAIALLTSIADAKAKQSTSTSSVVGQQVSAAHHCLQQQHQQFIPVSYTKSV